MYLELEYWLFASSVNIVDQQCCSCLDVMLNILNACVLQRVRRQKCATVHRRPTLESGASRKSYVTSPSATLRSQYTQNSSKNMYVAKLLCYKHKMNIEFYFFKELHCHKK